MVSVAENIWRGRGIKDLPPKTSETKRSALFKEFPFLKEIPQDKFPTHMLIIPDGNGRWATKNHTSVLEGHTRGKDLAVDLLRGLRPLDEIRFITLWGMSSDNFEKRDDEEKKNLFNLFNETLTTLTPELEAENGRFIHLGRKDRIPENLRELFNEVEEKTKDNTGQAVVLAVDYGGEDQELRMIQKAVKELPKDQVVTIETIESLRDGGGRVPPADLIIRTSGEIRTSGLGWLGEKAEFVAIKEFFPSIGLRDIISAIHEFSKRERRGGGRLKTTT